MYSGNQSDLGYSNRGKGSQSRGQNKSQKKEPQAWWSYPQEQCLIMITYEHFINNRLLSQNFTDHMWREITKQLNAATGDHFRYNENQVQAKWKRIKRQWKTYHRVLHGETGLGVDPDTGRLTGQPEQLEKAYAKEIGDDLSHLNHPIPHYSWCNQMWKKTTATGRYARSTATIPVDSDDEMAQGSKGQQGTRSTRERSDDEGTTAAGGSRVQAGPSTRRRKTEHSSSRDDQIARVMEGLGGMFAERDNRNQEKMEASMDECYTILNSMEGLSTRARVNAMKRMRSATYRKMFLTMKDEEMRFLISDLDR